MAGTIYITQLNTARDYIAVRICFAGAGLTNKRKNYISTLYIKSAPYTPTPKKKEPHDKEVPPSE